MRLKWIKTAEGREVLVDLDFKGGLADKNLTRRDTLTAKEHRGLKLQLGRDFDSMSQVRAYMKANDMRFIDKGDRQDRARTRMKDWMKNTKPGERGRTPFSSTRG